MKNKFFWGQKADPICNCARSMDYLPSLGCDSNVWAVLEGSGAKEVMVGYGTFFCG